MSKNSTYFDFPELRKTWDRLKKENKEALLLMRIDDYYYLFEEDAEKTSPILGLDSFPFFARACSFHHSRLDVYLPKLLRAGHRVAIYDNK